MWEMWLGTKELPVPSAAGRMLQAGAVVSPVRLGANAERWSQALSQAFGDTCGPRGAALLQPGTMHGSIPLPCGQDGGDHAGLGLGCPGLWGTQRVGVAGAADTQGFRIPRGLG